MGVPSQVADVLNMPAQSQADAKMTDLTGDKGLPLETLPGSPRNQLAPYSRAGLILVFFALLFFSLSKVPGIHPDFHIAFSAQWREMIFTPVCLTIVIAAAFVFARFSFGYMAGFYLLAMMAGFFWLNAFSIFPYDHRTALISAAASMILFLIPSLAIGQRAWSTPLPRAVFDWLPDGILAFSVIILIVCAQAGFRLVGLEEMPQYRSSLVHSRIIEYAIGNINGALIPFAFACFVVRKRWIMLAAAIAVSLLYYPVTLTKVSLLNAPFLIGMAILSWRLEVRICVILSLLIPLGVGLWGVAGLDPIDMPRIPLIIFSVLDFRLFAVPASALDHYYAFFANHPLTYFCQISVIKPMLSCPYSDQLGIVMANQYHIGNMNASMFATEGVASVGPMLAPVVALACGVLISIANKTSAGLPQPFVLISGAIMPHVLLNIPLSTALLSNGLGLLMLLWCLTPRGLFGAPETAFGRLVV
jgi:hypothetical protein